MSTLGRMGRMVAVAAGVTLSATVAQAQQWSAILNGPSESPANVSPGTGSALVTYDAIAHTFRVQAVFTGLTGTTTASHIHCCTLVAGAGTAGVATMTPTFSGFPLGVTAGSFDMTYDMTLASFFNPAYVTTNGGTTASAFTALYAGMISGNAYLNIHTSTFPGGEIRGFLTVVTPEPSSVLLMGAGLMGILGFAVRRKRSTNA